MDIVAAENLWATVLHV